MSVSAWWIDSNSCSKASRTLGVSSARFSGLNVLLEGLGKGWEVEEELSFDGDWVLKSDSHIPIGGLCVLWIQSYAAIRNRMLSTATAFCGMLHKTIS